MPDTIHAIVQDNFGYELNLRYRQEYRFLPELALATAPDGTTPDLAVYPRFAPDYESRTARRADPPLCCVEIQPPSQSMEEMLSKGKTCFRFGVRSCWVVQPAVRGIFVFDGLDHYRVFHGDDTLRDEAPGAELFLAAVFA